MPKLSEIATPKRTSSESSESKPVKLSEIAKEMSVETDNPKQEKFNQAVDKGRQMVGKGFMATMEPARLGIQAAQGRLLSDNPFEQTMGNILESAGNTASYGIPRAMMKQVLESSGSGLKYPEMDKNSDIAGQIIGLISPAKTAQAIAAKVPGLAGRTVVQNIGRGVVEGAYVGFTESPEEFLNISQRIKQASLGGAIGGVAVPVSKGVENMGRVAITAKGFAQKVRNSLFESKKAIGDTFETQLDELVEKNPSKVINLQESFDKLKSLATENSRVVADFKSGAKKAGLDMELIEGFIKNPESAAQMTLNQAREIKQAVSKVPSIAANYKKGKFANFSDTDIDLIDFADDVKSKTLSMFPEMESINKTFSDKLYKYNLVKDKFKVGKLLDNIEKNFGDKEVQGVIKELLPKEVIQEMGGYRGAAKFLKTMGWVAASGATGATLAAGGKAAYDLFPKK